MWQNMGMYWAWRGKERCFSEPPTEKRLEYVSVHYPDWKPKPMTMQICCGVFDDDKYTELHREQIKWHETHGAKLTWKDHG
jgi:hypothetical protein